MSKWDAVQLCIQERAVMARITYNIKPGQGNTASKPLASLHSRHFLQTHWQRKRENGISLRLLKMMQNLFQMCFIAFLCL